MNKTTKKEIRKEVRRGVHQEIRKANAIIDLRESNEMKELKKIVAHLRNFESTMISVILELKKLEANLINVE